DASLSASSTEVLQHKDFEQMSAAEIALARKAITELRLTGHVMPTRRFEFSHRGRYVDMSRSIRDALRNTDTIPIRYRRQSVRTRPIIVLCDISGSMESYSRLFLHFMQALSNDRERVHGFVFGTRLTNITRYLKNRDIDASLAAISTSVADWSGGTRIGDCIKEFNQRWSRRVLGSGAIVLLVSDGLERDDCHKLERQVERLARSCHRLIWLNPLLRYDQFQPRALGVRAILPHVDEFRPVHNLQSLSDLVRELNRKTGRARAGLH
ncbi:MAG: VWA domain-containing protein, partial [Gammaproteobacteria bacterium]